MKNNTKYSSYWLRDDLFNDSITDTLDSVEKKTANLLTLASYKRAVGNFVNIVTNQTIPVKFNERGDNSYTDGKSVVISAKMNDTEFDPIVGLALHEGSHIKLTDFSILTDIVNGNFLHPIDSNYLLELEAKHDMTSSDTLRFVSNNVKDLLNVIEDRRIDYYIYSTSPGYKGYYHSMYNKYFNSKIIDKGIKSSEYRVNDWESYMFRIINITNENRDLDALPLLREVYNMIDLKNINRLENTQQSFKLACEIFKFIEDSLPSLKAQPQSDSGTSGESDDTESQSTDDSGGDNSQANGNDNTDGPKHNGQSKQDSTNGDDTDGDAEGDVLKSGRPSYNPNGSGGGITLSDKEQNDLKNAVEKQKKFQNGDVNKSKISKSDSAKIEILNNAGITQTVVGSDYNSGNKWRRDRATPVVVVRKFTNELALSNTINMLSTYKFYCDRNQINIDRGIQIGTVLGKRLKIRSEERSLITPRMKLGKISNRLIHELGVGNTQIFNQIVIDKHKPALVHISIDASSSMSGIKWNNSQIAAVAIAKAASMTPNIDVVISYRSIQHDPIQPLMLIAYDSRVDKFSKIQRIFKYLNASGSTPEGLCFESILDEIIKTKNGIDSYFINFSDGEPGFSNKDIEYYGNGAINHTAQQIKKMQNSGIKILSYFISNNNLYHSKFKEMYGKYAETIDVTSIIPLTRTLNKLFE